SIEAEAFTLSVTASESAAGPTGLLTATATTSFAVSVTEAAEAPTFSGPTVFSGSEEPGSTITLSGIAVSGDADDVFTSAPATVTGIPPGWKIGGGSSRVGATSGTATFAVDDHGALRITVPDAGGETATLTLSVTSQEGASGPTVTGSEILTVTASGVAEAPSFSGPTVFSGSEEPGSTITLSGIAVSGDADDVFTSAPATVTGIPLGW